MKILLASTSERAENGASKCLIELATELCERGYDITVSLPRNGTLEDALKDHGIQYVILRERQCWTIIKTVSKYIVLIKALLNSINFWKIKHYIKTNGFDIVHVNAVTSYLVGKAAISAGIPVVWHIREFLEEDLGLVFSDPSFSYQLIDRAHAIIAISNPVREHWQPKFSTEIKVINDGLPIERYLLTEKKSKNNTINVVLYGRITENKGQLFYVNGISRARNRFCRSVHFFYAGTVQKTDEDYYFEVKRAIENHSLTDCITFLEDVKDVKGMLSEMHIVCVCSKKEGFGRVTVEGMLGKCLVLGADTGATREIINDGETGFLYQEGNIEDFSDKLVKLVNNYESYIPIAENGQKTAKERYSLEFDIKQLEELYSNIHSRMSC